MRFLLDTNTCIHALRSNQTVIGAILSHRRAEIGVSVITAAELLFGASKSHRPTEAHSRLEAFLRPFETLDFMSNEAEIYGQLRAKLDRAGSPIGPLDTLIAAHAITQKLVLVTANEREFRRVPGLQIENWA